MKPFKDAYNQLCDVWIRANAGSRITDYDIAGLVNEAFTKVARLEIAVSGFKCTGIHPFDRNVFSDLDYLPAEMTNIPLEEPQTSLNAPGTSVEVSVSSTDLTVAGSSSMNCDSEQSNNLVSEELSEPSKQSTSETMISKPKPPTSLDPDVVQIIHNLSPLPDAAKKRSVARKRKCEKSEILTSSPYKIVVEEKENEKNVNQKRKAVGNKFRTAMKEKGKQTKGVKAKGNSGGKAKKKTPLTETSDTGTTCVVCLEDHDEDWIQCSSCRGWAHEACADIPECSESYICDRCTMF